LTRHRSDVDGIDTSCSYLYSIFQKDDAPNRADIPPAAMAAGSMFETMFSTRSRRKEKRGE
jgi:hypothetical protein